MSEIFIVFTIERCNDGDNFIFEKVFSSLLESSKYKLDLSYKYNTEMYPQKDKTTLEQEYMQVKEAFESYSGAFTEKDMKMHEHRFHNLMYKFWENANDPTAVDLPIYTCQTKKMVVDADGDREAFYYH